MAVDASSRLTSADGQYVATWQWVREWQVKLGTATCYAVDIEVTHAGKSGRNHPQLARFSALIKPICTPKS
jgi:hypothetical protein